MSVASDLAAARAELARVSAERVNVRAQLAAAGAPSSAPPPAYVPPAAPLPPPAKAGGAALVGLGLAGFAAWRFGWWPFKKRAR